MPRKVDRQETILKYASQFGGIVDWRDGQGTIHHISGRKVSVRTVLALEAKGYLKSYKTQCNVTYKITDLGREYLESLPGVGHA